MVEPADPETEAVCRIVDGLIQEYQERAIDIAGARERDHPLDHEAVENVMLVMQDLDMLASLRINLCRGGAR